MTPSLPEPHSRTAQRRPAVLLATLLVRFAFGLTVAGFAEYLTGTTGGLSGSSVGLVGWVTAAAPLGEFSTVLLAGLLTDSYGRFPVLLSGIGVAAGLFLAISFTTNPPADAALNLVFGVASGAILAASLAVFADEAAAGHRGYEMGRFDAVNLLGWVLGFAVGYGLLGVVPVSTFPWVFRGGSLALAGALAGAVWLGRGGTLPPLVAAFRLREIRDAIATPNVLLVTLPWLTIYALVGTAFVFLGSAASGVGVPTPVLALLIGVGGSILLLTQPWYGRLADRYGQFRLMLVGVVGFLAILLGVAAVAVFGPHPALLGAIGLGAAAALAYGPAALAALADTTRPGSRGTTMAVYSLVISLGMLIGLVASSQLYAAQGVRGLDLFFLAIGGTLTVLTLLRGLRERSLARVRSGSSATIPAR